MLPIHQYMYMPLLSRQCTLELWGVWWVVVFENQHMWKYQLVKHSPVITIMFLCFLYHFRSDIQLLMMHYCGIIAQSFLKVLVIDLSMFLGVIIEIWKFWNHQRVRDSLVVTILFSYHLYLLYIKIYERWCDSSIGMSRD